MPRHVRDVRARSHMDSSTPADEASDEDDWDWYVNSPREPVQDEGNEDVVAPEPEVAREGADDGAPRRSARIAARTHEYRRCPCEGEVRDVAVND